ncbi:NAD(P)/FAD-dependent oxidoreductase [Arthrobacter rhombi]|uniref:NAD(P)/FAD-dependent oxidoreductase n=1 Tax=Arthrobacter rhombi TaxID=71253 RepID=UPI003FD6A3E5
MNTESSSASNRGNPSSGPEASVLIIGAGLAGFSTARQLRSLGHTGRVRIVDPEGLPYDRPPLSKDYLLGRTDQTGLLLADAAWCEEHEIEILTGAVASLHPATGEVVLVDGTVLDADVLVLATGGTARKLSIPGGDLGTVLELRNRDDADRLRHALLPGTRLAIIGAGLIGAETASAARELGAVVVLIDPMDPPLVPAVGPELARRLHDMHAEQGVTVVTGIPESITRNEEHHVIVLANGESITADAVLVGVGITPNTKLAESAALEVDGGIIVDSQQRTSHRRVYAVGDCARTRSDEGVLKRRAEHWENAMNSGHQAAAAIAGVEAPAQRSDWFWSDRHGVHVEGVGSMTEPGTTVIRETDGVPVMAFRVDGEGYLLGCATVDGGLAVKAARRIIDRRIRVDPAQLADPSVNLKKLAR